MWVEIGGPEWYRLAIGVADERYLIEHKEIVSKYPVRGREHKFDYLLTIWGYLDAPYLKAEIPDGGAIHYYIWEGK